MTVSLADELIALLEPLAGSHGLDLVTVEVAGGHHSPIVRVFLDREGGIDIDAVAASNAWIEEALEGVARLSGPYTLEVSSPGIERVLRKRGDFERFCGQTVQLQLARGVSAKPRLTGALVRLDGEEVVIESDGQEHRVPFSDIERARLKADFGDVGGRNGKTS